MTRTALKHHTLSFISVCLCEKARPARDQSMHCVREGVQLSHVLQSSETYTIWSVSVGIVNPRSSDL